MLSHDEIEIFTGREHRILADKHKNYLLAQLFFCAEQRGKETEQGKWESEGRLKERGQKAGEEYGLGNWCKKKTTKNKEVTGKRGQQREEFTLGRLAAPQLPASSQIPWHLP